MAAKSRIAKWQKVQEVISKPTSGEQSSYWVWVYKHNRVDENGFAQESRLGNPDTIADDEVLPEPDTINRKCMREAIKQAKLSPRQRAIIEFLGIMGYSEEKTAKLLGVTRSTVRVLFRRAQKKCEAAYVTILANHGDIGENTQENL